MKTKFGGNLFPRHFRAHARIFVVAALFLGLLANSARAFVQPPGYNTNQPSYTPLNFWWFDDDTNWTSSRGSYPPLSFTNISSSYLGDGPALVVDDPANPAWLQFPVTNLDATVNLAVAVGSVAFWYAPDWSGTNQGGSGPGEFARLLEVGGFTPDSSFGLWSLYVDDVGQNLYFSAQTNDLSGNFCTYVTAPIAWTTNYWHFIVFTYSTTNTALYLDGELATNGPPLTNYPGPNALANGFFIGSDSNGLNQAEGMIDDLYTYNTPLDAGTIYSAYFQDSFYYEANPLNHCEITAAGSNPSTNPVTPDAITGTGSLQLIGTGNCSYATNADTVWLTNITAVVAGNGTLTVTFTIQGGQAGSGAVFDVFANSVLGFGANSLPWSWMGQGVPCDTYQLTGMPTNNCFLILGTPQDSDGADLTDAYQALVTHTSGNTNSVDGLLTGWEALLGLNPLNNNLTDSTKRANYGYTAADWLNGVTGIKSGSITDDAEGNVTTVAQ